MKKIGRLVGLTVVICSWIPGALAQNSQVIQHCDSSAAISFPNNGCTYQWVNSSPGIGLTAAGIGNIPSFIAQNNGDTPLVATITATPVATEYAFISNSQLNYISVFNILTDSLVDTIGTGSIPWGVSISPDGRYAYVTNDNPNGTVSVINTENYTLRATILIGPFPFGIALSPDGSLAYVTNNNYNGTLSVINTTNFTVTATIPVGSFPFGVVVSPDGSRVYLTNNYTNGTVYVISAATDAVIDTIPVGSLPYGIAISPDGNLLYVTNNNSNTVSLINTSTLQVIGSIPVGQGPTGIVLSADGKTAYVANAVSQTVSVINTVNNSVIATIPVGSLPWGISISPDGNWLIVSNQGSNSITVISTATHSIVNVISGFSGPVSFGNFISQGPVCNAAPITFTITVDPQLPASVQINASADAICAGVLVNFTATPVNGGIEPSYQWVVNGADSGGNSPFYSSSAIQDGDRIYCIMTSSNACSQPDSSAVIQMTVNPLPAVQFNPDTLYMKNSQAILLTPLISGLVTQYLWSPAAGLDSVTIANPLANPASTQEYQLMVTTDSGCKAEAKVLVVTDRPFAMPNAFTPNGDGHNDLFRIPPGVAFNLAQFSIFDRWGNLVFTTQDISQGWNGKYKGADAGIGTYVYFIRGTSLVGIPISLKGSFVLIR